MDVTRLLEPAGFTAQSLVVMDAARLAWEVGDAELMAGAAVIARAGAGRSETPTRRAMAAMCDALADRDIDALVRAADELDRAERVWDAAVALHIAGLEAAGLRRQDAAALLERGAAAYRALGCRHHAALAREGLRFAALHRHPGGTAGTASGSTAGPAADRPSVGSMGGVAGASAATLDAARPELSPAERRVLALIGAGRANGEIAAELYVSKRTVESHVASLYRKLGVSTRVALALLADSQVTRG